MFIGGFVVGIFVGAFIGVIGFALVIANREMDRQLSIELMKRDFQKRYEDLFAQRDLDKG